MLHRLQKVMQYLAVIILDAVITECKKSQCNNTFLSLLVIEYINQTTRT